MRLGPWNEAGANARAWRQAYNSYCACIVITNLDWNCTTSTRVKSKFGNVSTTKRVHRRIS